jgi:hypothetical protein
VNAVKRRDVAPHASSSAPTTGKSWPGCSSACANGFGRYDAEEIDAFELDELIHRYKRSTRERWKFCANPPEMVAWLIQDAREQGDVVDWWAAGEPRRRR